MRDVYIVECLRSPLGRGKKGGALSLVRPVDLLAHVLRGVVDKAGLDAKYVEDVVCGCVTPINQQGGNIGRFGVLKANYPITTPGVQIDRLCGSGQQAIHFVAQEIASGDMDVGVASGVEMMSVEKMGKSFSSSMGKLLSDFPYRLISQGMSAEKMAVEYGITRQDCDELAFNSHLKAGLARNKGFFDYQILPIMCFDPKSASKTKGSKKVKYETREVNEDEGIRYPPNRASIAKLRTVFKKGGVITAGNASQITDGSSAVLLASARAVKKHNLKVRARILTRVVVGSDPILMLDGVIPATEKALKRSGLKLSDIDLFEINEAFAVVVCAWQKTLNIDWNKVNIDGGACAHGHPLGATGCVLMTKLVNALEREGKRYGLLTMCIGWGMATATIIERCNTILPPKSQQYWVSKL